MRRWLIKIWLHKESKKKKPQNNKTKSLLWINSNSWKIKKIKSNRRLKIWNKGKSYYLKSLIHPFFLRTRILIHNLKKMNQIIIVKNKKKISLRPRKNKFNKWVKSNNKLDDLWLLDRHNITTISCRNSVKSKEFRLKKRWYL